MWTYNKMLQYPINIKCTDPRLAKVIISQYGGPDGELAASLRYLSQRFGMPDQNAKAILNDIRYRRMITIMMSIAKDRNYNLSYWLKNISVMNLKFYVKHAILYIATGNFLFQILRIASRKCDSMKLYYVPTITSQKYVPTPVKGVTAPKTNFHIDIYEIKRNDKELIGTASVVLGGPPHHDRVLYIRVETKYEHTTYTGGSVYHNMTLKELKAEHYEIVEACKELKEAWG